MTGEQEEPADERLGAPDPPGESDEPDQPMADQPPDADYTDQPAADQPPDELDHTDQPTVHRSYDHDSWTVRRVVATLGRPDGHGPARWVAVVVVLVVGVVMVRVVAGPVGPLAIGRGSERSPAQTVADFYEAQRTGDCERLLDLLTQDSWSDDGERSRAEFLDQCADAVQGYQPDVEAIRLDDPEGGRVDVGFGMPDDGSDAVDDDPDDSDAPGGRGTLVREGGEWKVRAEPTGIHVGRSVEETLAGYVDAYNAGDCGRLVDLLDESVWSDDGALDRDQYLELCQQQADRRTDQAQADVVLGIEELSVHDDGTATARVMLSDALSLSSDGGQEGEEARLVRRGLEWKLIGIEDRGPLAAGVPFVGMQLLDVRTMLIDLPTLEQQGCTRFYDDVAGVRDGEAPPGVARDMAGSCDMRLTVFWLDGEDQAQAFADELAASILDEPLPTVAEVTETGSIDPADIEAYVASRRPNQASPVPGIPEARGLRTGCDVDGCLGAAAIAAVGPYVVEAKTIISADTADVAALLRNQMEVL